MHALLSALVTLAAPGLPTVHADLPADAKVVANRLADGHTVSLLFRSAPRDLADRLAALHARAVRILANGDKSRETVVYLTFDEEARDVAVVRRQRVSDLTIRLAGRLDALAERIAQPLPAPEAAGDAMHLVREAEQALVARDYNEAEAEFIQMHDVYVLGPWADLRLADLQVLRHGVAGGCTAYARVLAQHPDRAVGLVAALRRHVLACPAEPDVRPAKLDWVALLQRARSDDPSSRWLSSEARWVLTWSPERSLRDDNAAYGDKLLGLPLFNQLLAQLMTAGTPLEVTTTAKDYAPYLAAHPNAPDLHVLQVVALCQLELPREAGKVAADLAQHKPAQWLTAAARCDVAPPKHDGAAASEGRALARSLNDLHARLAQVQAAVHSTAAAAAVQQGDRTP